MYAVDVGFFRREGEVLYLGADSAQKTRGDKGRDDAMFVSALNVSRLAILQNCSMAHGRELA